VVDLAILDYGSGNLRSAERALARAGASVVVTTDVEVAATAPRLVVPGVGAFAACMAGLEPYRDMIVERVRSSRPVLGICVGMQVFFEYGDEHGIVTKGLGLLPGGVTRLVAPRVPHMGWNSVKFPEKSVLFAGADPDERYYFVHSYAAAAAAPIDGALVTTAEHGRTFVAAVEAGPLTVTQFHPEKSGDAGATLLRNWLAAG
jgi:glutamine amidotransferase